MLNFTQRLYFKIIALAVVCSLFCFSGTTFAFSYDYSSLQNSILRNPLIFDKSDQEGVTKDEVALLPGLSWGFFVTEIRASQQGGIGDVAEGLPLAIANAPTLDGIPHRVSRFSPYYRDMKQMTDKIGLGRLDLVVEMYIPYQHHTEKLDVYDRILSSGIRDNFYSSEVFTSPYEKSDIKNPDEALKEAVIFCAASAMLVVLGDVPLDVLFLSDWQTGLILSYLRESLYEPDALLRKITVKRGVDILKGEDLVERFISSGRAESIVPVHWVNNAAYRGTFPMVDKGDFTWKTGLVSRENFEHARWMAPENHDEQFMMLLKLGAEEANIWGGEVRTVSQTHANELMGIDLLPGEEPDVLWGIYRRIGIKGRMNGVLSEWSYLASLEDIIDKTKDTVREEALQKKDKKKIDLQKRLGWREGDDKIIVFMISRLVTQKGVALLVNGKEEIKGLLREYPDVQLFIGGPPEDSWKAELENLKDELEMEFPDRVRIELGWVDAEGLGRRVYEAGDIQLFISYHEPAGSLWKGAVNMVLTVARSAGGLIDSSVPIKGDSGNAVMFEEYSPGAFIGALRKLLDISRDMSRFKKLQQNAPLTVKTWDNQAREYMRGVRDIRREKGIGVPDGWRYDVEKRGALVNI